MDRRNFIKTSAAAVAALTVGPAAAAPTVLMGKKEKNRYGKKMKGHFSLTQISSATDTIGESYLMKTSGGKVIMVDGGYASDVEKLRRHLAKAGNHVDLWMITHPHEDHMEALATILADPQGITVRRVVYSRVPDEFLDCEKGSADNARGYYRVMDNFMDGTDFVNVHQAGQRFDIDGIGIMILSVADMSLKRRLYNEQSMIIRMWDDKKSVIFLGDAEVERGDSVLAQYREFLDCDYLQMAHHGQNGVSEQFYKTINFRACLWPTPSWVWDPAPENNWLKTRDTRRWMDEKGITEHHVSCLEEDWTLL